MSPSNEDDHDDQLSFFLPSGNLSFQNLLVCLNLQILQIHRYMTLKLVSLEISYREQKSPSNEFLKNE